MHFCHDYLLLHHIAEAKHGGCDQLNQSQTAVLLAGDCPEAMSVVTVVKYFFVGEFRKRDKKKGCTLLQVRSHQKFIERFE